MDADQETTTQTQLAKKAQMCHTKKSKAPYQSLDMFDKTCNASLVGQQLVGFVRRRVDTSRPVLLRGLAVNRWKSF